MPRKNNRPSYQRLEPSKTCQSKRRFKTKVEAESAAKYQSDINLHLELSVHRCQSCGGWHLTSLSEPI